MKCVADESDFEIDNGIYAIKFSATWCAPCKRMEPTISKLESEFSSVKFLSVDIDDVPALAQKYKIKSLPTILLIKDGQEIDRIVGLSLIEPLRKIFRDLVEDLKDLADI